MAQANTEQLVRYVNALVPCCGKTQETNCLCRRAQQIEQTIVTYAGQSDAKGSDLAALLKE